MKKLQAIGVALTSVALTSVSGLAKAAPIGYVLGNGGTTLHAFDVASPVGATSVTLSLGGAAATLQDIDFRPLTGQLYGYSDLNNAYYTVDVNTGALTAAGSGAATSTDKLGIDFNPTIDMLRTVTELRENIVFNPTTGSTTVATNLFYAPGDPNAGVPPQVVANAYTNSVLGMLSATTAQFVLDANLNTLATLANNAGTLGTIGTVTLNGSPLDFGPDAGFDIFTSPVGVNTAYALLNVGSRASLYTIDLATAAATLVRDLPGNFGTIRGLAVTPTAAVPEPSAIVLAGIAAAGFLAPRILRCARGPRA